MATTTPSTEITLNLPTDLVEAVDRLAERTDRVRDDVIAELLRLQTSSETAPVGSPRAEAITESDPDWPTIVGIIDGSPVSSEEFEDWMQANWRPAEPWGRS